MRAYCKRRSWVASPVASKVMRFMRGTFLSFCAVIACVLAVGQPLSAQTSDELDSLDLEPPVIEHESLIDGKAGLPQQFDAVVTDDRGVQQVTLYYRSDSFAGYIAAQMIESDGVYAATVPTTGQQRRIEYYLEARDTGGNRVLQGFPAYPLVRNLLQAAVPASSPPVQANQSTSPSRTAIAVGAGLLGLLLLAGLSSSGDGGEDNDSNGGGGEPSQTVPLTINATIP